MIRSQETIIEKHHVVFLYHTKKGLLADNPVYFRPKLYKYPLQIYNSFGQLHIYDMST